MGGPVVAFAQALRAPLLLDGGLATALEASGRVLDDPLWSAKLLLDDPQAIVDAHRAFVDAGADVITTAAYQASLRGLRAAGLSEAEALATIERATTLARTAATDRPVFVAASAGPYGAALADGSEYRGDYGVRLETLVDFHAQRLPALATADVVAFETVPCRIEAEAIARACGRLSLQTPAWVSFSALDDAHAASGEPIEQCVASVLDSPHVVAVGVNCCAPRDVLGLLSRISSVTDLPLVAYPNAGRRYRGGAWHGEGLSPQELADLSAQWIAAGARVIGGCCQIGIEHLRAQHDALRRSSP